MVRNSLVVSRLPLAICLANDELRVSIHLQLGDSKSYGFLESSDACFIFCYVVSTPEGELL